MGTLKKTIAGIASGVILVFCYLAGEHRASPTTPNPYSVRLARASPWVGLHPLVAESMVDGSKTR